MRDSHSRHDSLARRARRPVRSFSPHLGEVARAFFGASDRIVRGCLLAEEPILFYSIIPSCAAVRNGADKIIFYIGAAIVAKRILIDCAGQSCGSGLGSGLS